MNKYDFFHKNSTNYRIMQTDSVQFPTGSWIKTTNFLLYVKLHLSEHLINTLFLVIQFHSHI